MGGAVSAGQDNEELISNLCDANYIKSKKTENVFRTVDRGEYFPGEHLEDAYKDLAWKQGNVHISAPCIYCEVLEAFGMEEGMSFLNLGSGTGYLSTMVGLLIGPYGTNHGVELFQDVIDYANDKVAKFLRHNEKLDPSKFCMPRFVAGNCLMLNPQYRKYDRVYCGAACLPEHESFLKSLLKINGILIVPIRDTLVSYKRVSATEWEATTLLPVQFAPLIEPEQKDIAHEIIEIASNPYTLQEISRFSILKYLGENSSRVINTLPLPEPLLRYLDFYREPIAKIKKVERRREKPVMMALVLQG